MLKIIKMTKYIFSEKKNKVLLLFTLSFRFRK